MWLGFVPWCHLLYLLHVRLQQVSCHLQFAWWVSGSLRTTSTCSTTIIQMKLLCTLLVIVSRLNLCNTQLGALDSALGPSASYFRWSIFCLHQNEVQIRNIRMTKQPDMSRNMRMTKQPDMSRNIRMTKLKPTWHEITKRPSFEIL